jgi:hypothetical protein
MYTALTEAAIIDISGGGTSFCLNSLTMVLALFASRTPSLDSIIIAAQMGGMRLTTCTRT